MLFISCAALFTRNEDMSAKAPCRKSTFIGPNKRLYIIGRHKDMIVRGGENLSPKIEEALTQKPELLALEP